MKLNRKAKKLARELADIYARNWSEKGCDCWECKGMRKDAREVMKGLMLLIKISRRV